LQALFSLFFTFFSGVTGRKRAKLGPLIGGVGCQPHPIVGILEYALFIITAGGAFLQYRNFHQTKSQGIKNKKIGGHI